MPDEVMSRQPGEPSETIQQRVITARDRQRERFADAPFHCNADMNAKALRHFCPLSPEVENLLRAAIDQFGLSARAFDRIVKLSRTIADLEGTEAIAVHHAAEAVQYRSLDRKFWG